MKELCNGKIDNTGICGRCYQVSQTTSGYCTRLIDVQPEVLSEANTEKIKHVEYFDNEQGSFTIVYDLHGDDEVLITVERSKKKAIETCKILNKLLYDVVRQNTLKAGREEIIEILKKYDVVVGIGQNGILYNGIPKNKFKEIADEIIGG